MTVAELRAYCSYIRKVGVDAHKVLNGFVHYAIPDCNEEHSDLTEKAIKLIQQLEVLGLSSK